MTFKELQDALSDWLAMNEKRLPVSARKQIINLALVEVQKRALWRFCYYTTTSTLLAGTNLLATPQDMIEPESITYTSSSGAQTIVEFLPPGEFEARFGKSVSSGEPTKYTIQRNNFVFNTAPTGPINMNIGYYRLLPPLVNDNDNNDFTNVAWDVILYTALELASIFGIEDPRVPLLAQKKEEALRRLLVTEGRLGASTYRPKSRLQDDAATE